MVDFQERDTTRGLGDEDDAEAAADDPDAASTSDEPEPDEPEPTDDENDAPVPSEHHHDQDLETVSVAVVTISDTRTIDEDGAGDAIVAALDESGHEVATRNLIRDDYDTVQSEVDTLVRREDVDAVVTTGGTGVSPQDVTVEAVRPLFEKELPGFGELFRALSREQIGTRVVATRAVAGIAEHVPIFCLPGSEAAARLGTREIVVPEVCHLAGVAEPDDETEDPLSHAHNE